MKIINEEHKKKSIIETDCFEAMIDSIKKKN